MVYYFSISLPILSQLMKQRRLRAFTTHADIPTCVALLHKTDQEL
jgi:hypothetical protein